MKRLSKHLRYIELWLLFLYFCFYLHPLPYKFEVSSTKLHSILPCSLTLDSATYFTSANGRWIDMRQVKAWNVRMPWDLLSCALCDHHGNSKFWSSLLAPQPRPQSEIGGAGLSQPEPQVKGEPLSQALSRQPNQLQEISTCFISRWGFTTVWLLHNKNWWVEKSVPRNGAAAIMKT